MEVAALETGAENIFDPELSAFALRRKLKEKLCLSVCFMQCDEVHLPIYTALFISEV